MEKEGNGVPNSESLPVQSVDSGKERNAPSRSTTAIWGGPRRGLSPWAVSPVRALPVPSDGRLAPFRSSASSVTRNSPLIRRPVVQHFEEDFGFQDTQPQVARDDDVSCFFDTKSALTAHTPDGTTALVATSLATAQTTEGNAVPNTSTAKRGSAALSEEEKKRRNREYAKRHRMKSLEAKSRQEQYIAELESQCNTLHTQVEAGKTRILELEEQVERMSAREARCATLEEQVKNLKEENRRLLMAQEIKQTALATSSPAVDGPPARAVDLGTNLDPYVSPHEPVTTQNLGFLKRR